MSYYKLLNIKINIMEDLVEYIDRTMKEMAEEMGLKMVFPEEEKKKDGPITGTITFLKGESAKKAAEFFDKKEE